MRDWPVGRSAGVTAGPGRAYPSRQAGRQGRHTLGRDMP